MSRYATEHGQKPLDVAFSDSASQLGSNARYHVEALYGAITNDPLGLVVDTVNGAYESVVTCVTTSTCIAPDQTHGTARDRQLVAELQGNADVAVAEAADDLGATLVELTAVPGVGKAAKSGVVGLVDTAVDQGRKNAGHWAKGVRPATVERKKDISRGLDIDEKMVGQDEPIYAADRNVGNAVPDEAVAPPIIDYSRGFERDLSNFKLGYELLDSPLDDDLILVSYHGDVPLGEGRSAKWWTSTDQANAMTTIDDVHQGLALPYEWGARDAVSVIKILKGTNITAYKGRASPQLGKTGELFEGDAIQYRFKEFDPNWVIDSQRVK